MKQSFFAAFVGVCCFLFPPYTIADDDPITIVITASRKAETVDEAMVPVSVIEREDIDRKQAQSIPDVLRDVPGLTVSRNGGQGAISSIFLRGTESDHVLVLIDGVKVGSATAGTTPFQDLPLDQVEKIEVVRGPRSSLYGSEAVGGVIHIFTRRGQQGTQPVFSIGAGSENTAKVNGGISGGNGRSWYSVNASAFTTDGIDACRGDFSAGCFTVEPDDDGYQNTSISLRGGVDVNDRLSVDANILNSDNETEFDGSFQNETETVTRVSSLRAVLEAGDRWQSSLLLGQTLDESENFLDGAFASSFDTTRDQISWLNRFLVGEISEIIAGMDYIDDEVDSSDPFDVSNRDNLGVFLSLRTMLSDNDIEVSLRNDDNEQFGNEATGGLAWGRDLDGGLRATASYGTAFRAPSFNELYFPGFGNPELDPETSQSFDLGLARRSGTVTWSLNVFHTVIEDLIGFDPVTFLPVNINEGEITGLEMTGRTKLGEWDLASTLTLQDPVDSGGGPNNGNQLPRRAKTLFNIDADRGFGRFSAGASLRYQGDSYDDLANATELDAFVVVDLRGEYRINSHWAAGLALNNVLDEEYETAAYYNQPGANFLATLRYVPGN